MSAGLPIYKCAYYIQTVCWMAPYETTYIQGFCQTYECWIPDDVRYLDAASVALSGRGKVSSRNNLSESRCHPSLGTQCPRTKCLSCEPQHLNIGHLLSFSCSFAVANSLYISLFSVSIQQFVNC
jgi:hypothetical protein